VADERPRVLCVDDETHVTKGLERVLRSECTVVTANTAAEALDLIRREPPFAVVIADFQMPEMNGAAFLAEARVLAPDMVRILATGRTDLATAAAAINEGQIFRFLSKPTPAAVLLAVVSAAYEQHRLLTSERELLEQTLLGSIKALVSVLALTHPVAFGRTSRVKRVVSEIAERLPVPNRWSVEVAALLSQIGCVALPEALVAKLARGDMLSLGERDAAARLPALAESTIAGIPRLEAVRAILRHQDTRFDGGGSPEPNVRGDAIPLGARVLKAVLDFDALHSRHAEGGAASGEHAAASRALDEMEARVGWYDPAILGVLRELHAPPAPSLVAAATSPHPTSGSHVQPRSALIDADAGPVRQMRLADVRAGMIFNEDLVLADGMLLVARGQEVTSALVARIWHHWYDWATTHSVRMIVPTTAADSAARSSSRRQWDEADTHRR
jgi:response regulator RpfG family c-di-GMP phosphodiesterase